MELFPKIDREKTKSAVKSRLKYFRFLHRISGAELFPAFDKNGNIKSVSGECSKKEAVIAQEKKEEILESINKLSNLDYRKVLFEKYISKYKRDDLELILSWNYSHTAFYSMFDRAIFEFSEVYRNGELIKYIDDTELIDFLEDF